MQYVAEIRKPDGKRLDGYHDSQLESLRFRLFSPAPIYLGLEEALIVDGMKQQLEELGADDPYVKILLDGKTPEEAAKALLAGTRLTDPVLRRKLVDGGEATVVKSSDPFIVLARKLDPIVRELNKMAGRQHRKHRQAGRRKDRPGPFRHLRQKRLSRRHLHPAPVLWRRSRAIP